MSRMVTIAYQENRVAFYDFSVSPTSYDFTQFIVTVKAFTQNLHVVFVPGEHEGFRQDHKPISTAERRFRVDHILIPLCTAIGATYTLCDTREQAESYYSDGHWPMGYDISKPEQAHTLALPIAFAKQGVVMPPFMPSQRAFNMVEKMFDVAPIVVTLRECYIAERNSNIEAWLDFYNEIKRERPVVFIRDTEKWAEPFPAPTCQAAAIDLDMRLALYQLAHVNMGVNNGPMAMNIFSERPYLDFKFWNDATPSTSRMLTKWGLPRGSQFLWANEKQRIVWEGDDFITIMNAYREMFPVEQRMAA